MKEFDKKSSPSGREGFSKFLPASMSDSSTRRRLTEYEIQVQDLQAYIRSLEAETVHLRAEVHGFRFERSNVRLKVLHLNFVLRETATRARIGHRGGKELGEALSTTRATLLVELLHSPSLLT